MGQNCLMPWPGFLNSSDSGSSSACRLINLTVLWYSKIPLYSDEVFVALAALRIISCYFKQKKKIK